MSVPNRFAGRCRCGVAVAAEAGSAHRSGNRWAVLCQPCTSRAAVPATLMAGLRVSLSDELASGQQLWLRGTEIVARVGPNSVRGSTALATEVRFSGRDYPGGLAQVADAVAVSQRMGRKGDDDG